MSCALVHRTFLPFSVMPKATSPPHRAPSNHLRSTRSTTSTLTGAEKIQGEQHRRQLGDPTPRHEHRDGSLIQILSDCARPAAVIASAANVSRGR